MSDNRDFEDSPGLEYHREQGRGSDGAFYFKLDEVRCEYGGFYSAETAASTLALAVPDGKILHIKSVNGYTTSSGSIYVTLKEGSAAGKTVHVATLIDYGDSGNNVNNIFGLLVSGDIYASLNTFPTGVGVHIGGILDPNPTRE